MTYKEWLDYTLELIDPLLKRGYNITLEFSDDLVYIDTITAGDSNSPYPHYYCPAGADGFHGYTYIEFDDFGPTEDFSRGQGDSFIKNITKQMIEFIETHEGKRYDYK